VALICAIRRVDFDFTCFSSMAGARLSADYCQISEIWALPLRRLTGVDVKRTYQTAAVDVASGGGDRSYRHRPGKHGNAHRSRHFIASPYGFNHPSLYYAKHSSAPAPPRFLASAAKPSSALARTARASTAVITSTREPGQNLRPPVRTMRLTYRSGRSNWT
jgi:hypothetical protein